MHTSIEIFAAGDRTIGSVNAFNLEGQGRTVVLCDHASNHVPAELQGLGLSGRDFERAIAYDLGAAFVAEFLALRLDAPLVCSTVSRLVIDCNRPLASAESIPEFSEDTPIPGNIGITEEERRRRAALYFWPYHDCISALLDRRAKRGIQSWIISVHSFTPVYCGDVRPWHVGFSYARNPALARELLPTFAKHPELVVGDNQPYPISDDGDYSIPVHADGRGLPGVLIEIRQDLLDTANAARSWAERISGALAMASLDG